MLLKLAALGTLGYLGYRYYEKNKAPGNAAYADNQVHDDQNAVRDAGPEAMRDKPAMKWDKTDEESDESFPASDPPANY